MGVLSLTSLVLGMWIMPVYRQWLQESRLEMKARQLLLTLTFARTVAMQRYQKITLCKSADAQSCGGAWQDGWIVLTNSTSLQPGTQVLQFTKGLDSNQSIAFYGARHAEAVMFQPCGTSEGYNGRFVLCAKGSKIAWFIFVSPTGRSRLEASRDLSDCDQSGL